MRVEDHFQYVELNRAYRDAVRRNGGLIRVYSFGRLFNFNYQMGYDNENCKELIRFFVDNMYLEVFFRDGRGISLRLYMGKLIINLRNVVGGKRDFIMAPIAM